MTRVATFSNHELGDIQNYWQQFLTCRLLSKYTSNQPEENQYTQKQFYYTHVDMKCRLGMNWMDFGVRNINSE